MIFGPNVTGWSQLMDANLIGASFAMYDEAFVGLVVAILFIVYQIMLYLKTNDITLCWVTGAIFAGIYITGNIFSSIVHSNSVWVIFVLLVFELAIIIYTMVFK